MTRHFDAIVVGAGQAGPPLAGRLTAAGHSVAVVERKLIGGTCVNTGCIPTKTLVASAHTAHLARRGADYGVGTGSVSVDMAKVKARKDDIMLADRRGVEDWLQNMDGCTVIRGHARFEDPHTLRVGDDVLHADRIFLNLGGRAVVPDIPGLSDVEFLTNVSILELDTLPEHLVIIGGGSIGLEFAQMYRRFGSRVTVLEYGDRLIAREDREVSRAVQTILEREAIDFHFGVQSATVTAGAGGHGVRVALPGSGQRPEIEGSHLLAAVGRKPNTDDLGLERAGIATDARGYITVDEELRTSVAGVWALGDVNGRGAFTHTSYNDYQIVADNLLDGARRKVSDRIAAYALFTDPPLGRVGMSEAEVRARGKPALVGTMPMKRVGRARERGETQGFMKVLVDAESERILGASLLCIEGDEIVHSLLDIMAADASYRVVARAVHIHPTVSELIPTLLGDLVPLAPA